MEFNILFLQLHTVTHTHYRVVLEILYKSVAFTMKSIAFLLGWHRIHMTIVHMSKAIHVIVVHISPSNPTQDMSKVYTEKF